MFKIDSSHSSKISQIIAITIIFSFTFLYFSFINPIVPFDADDWLFLAFMRAPIPIWNAWNPGRVLPEFITPLTGLFSAKIIYPITGDYISSFTYTTSFIVTAAISLYVFMFSKLFKTYFHLNDINTALIALAFWILHFGMTGKNIVPLFWCTDMTCYYFYLIPSLMNFTIIFWSLNKKKFDFSIDRRHIFQSLILWTILYFAIFSNLYSSFILLIYASFLLIWLAIREKISSKNMISFFTKHLGLFVIQAMWFVSAVFEYYGARSTALVNRNNNFKEGIISAVKHFFDFIFSGDINLTIIIFFALSFPLFFFILHSKTKLNALTKFQLSLVLFALSTLLYLMLLSATVNPNYVKRIQVMFPALSAFLITILFSYHIVQHTLIKKSFLALFVVSSIFFFIVGNTSTCTHIPLFSKKEISKNLVEQVIHAARNKEDSLILNVPLFHIQDGLTFVHNWPLSEFIGTNMAKTLYRHGLISTKPKVITNPNEDFNLQFHVTPNTGLDDFKHSSFLTNYNAPSKTSKR
ncbi:MAG: hypothetical protein MJY87_01730 [Fibrobacter sp.]|nr:hypothetical protein [Fibrobacter sp.]